MTLSSKEHLLRIVRATGLFRWLRWYHRHEVLVLTYHSVVEGVQKHRRRHPLVYRNAVDADRFEQQMRYLRRHYHPLNGPELRAVLEGAPPPTRAVVVTFDDGLLNNKTVALPILRQVQMPAVFFLPTGFVDAASQGSLRRHWTEDLIARFSRQVERDTFDPEVLGDHLPTFQMDPDSRSPSEVILRAVDHLKSLPRSHRTDRLTALQADLGDPPPDSAFPGDPKGNSILATMTWDDAREVAEQEDTTLGSHTVNHTILSRQAEDAAAREIQESRRRIREETNQPADLFAYPNGRAQDFGTVHQELLTHAGYRGAFTQISGFNPPSTNPMRLRRIDVSPNHALSMFCYFASGSKLIVDRLLGR